MLRAIHLHMLGVLAALVTLAAPVSANADALELSKVLRMDEVLAVMQEEGIAYGIELEADMLEGGGGALWSKQIATIHDPARLSNIVTQALDDGMSDSQIAQAIAFFQTPLGQHIMSLETSARVAMGDDGIEQFARDTYSTLKGTQDPRLRLVTRFVAINDLIELNVKGALESNYYFQRGLVDGGAFDLSEAEITSDIWDQEEETRADTESWVYGYLLMAYGPLSDAELEAYIAYSATDSGQALNAAMFDGFDAGYRTISYELGLLVARASKASDL